MRRLAVHAIASLAACGGGASSSLDAPSAADAAGKAVRDAFGGAAAHVRLSPNFALKWDDGVTVDDATADALLDALEETWRVELGELGYPAPVGTDAARLNVYVGSSGPGTPAAYPPYAYYDEDPDGQPMLVYSIERLANPEQTRSSTAHEFFHAVQAATGAYPTSSDWWFEATATWIAEEVFPDAFDAGYLLAAGSYAMLPHLGLAHYELPRADWTVVQGHQYGAFLFARALSDVVADDALIRATWLEAEGEPDVLRVLDRLLSARGGSARAAFATMAAHNATWTYPSGAAYEAAVAELAAAYPADDHRFVADVPAAGVALHDAPAATLPEHAGYNVLRLPSARFTVDVVGDDVTGVLVPGATLDEPASLVVTAWSWDAPPGATFPYRVAVTPTP